MRTIRIGRRSFTALALLATVVAAPCVRSWAEEPGRIEESDLPDEAAVEPARDAAGGGSPGAKVEHGLSHAGEATHRGIEHGAEPVGRGLERAMKATGRGLNKAIEKTGEALHRAGDALTGHDGD